MAPPDPHGDLRAAYEAARAALTPVPLDFAEFERVWTVAGPAAAAIPGRAADLYLAAACAAGADAAWTRLRAEWFPRVRSFLLRRGARPDEADAAIDDLAGYLCDRPAGDGHRPRIASYRGESALATWLSVVAARLLGRHRTRAGGHAALPESDGVPAGPEARPLDEVAGREQAAMFERALHDAWRALTPRECLAVQLRFRDGLRQKDIARLLGVGEPRVSRLVEAGVARLRDEVRRRLRETPPDPARRGGADLWQQFLAAVGRAMASTPPAGH